MLILDWPSKAKRKVIFYEIYLNEVALITVAQSSCCQLGSLRFSGLDVTQDLVELFFVDLRSLLIFKVERVADGSLLGAFNGSLNELIIDGLLNHDARTGAATLTLIICFDYQMLSFTQNLLCFSI